MRRFRIVLIGAAAASVLAAPASADVRRGVEAWSRGDWAVAVREWQGPADAGDADAQFNLGQAYKLGRGVRPDLAKAEELFGRAAKGGHLQAADNYGLLLFQRGEHARALPYVKAAAEHGDARAQYLLGIAHFNGDNVPKDWVRAYALVSLAQQAGLPQAAPALAQMDQYIPLDQRQQSVPLAAQLASAADATRNHQLAAADLGVADRSGVKTWPVGESMGTPATREPTVPAEQAAAAAARAAASPRTAGADYTRPRVPQVSRILDEGQAKPPVAAAPRPAPALARPTAPAPTATGNWRVQLGAFGVAANADALWAKVRGRPELAGHGRINVPAGRITKLQAGGFASQSDAAAACSRLSAAGVTCLPVRD